MATKKATDAPKPEELTAEQKEIQALKAENAKMRAALDSGENLPAEVPGDIELSWQKPDGKTHKATYKFTPGHRAVRLKDGARVSSAGLLQLANDGKVEDKYLQESAALGRVTQEQAIARLTALAQMKYAYFVVK